MRYHPDGANESLSHNRGQRWANRRCRPTAKERRLSSPDSAGSAASYRFSTRASGTARRTLPWAPWCGRRLLCASAARALGVAREVGQAGRAGRPLKRPAPAEGDRPPAPKPELSSNSRSLGCSNWRYLGTLHSQRVVGIRSPKVAVFASRRVALTSTQNASAQRQPFVYSTAWRAICPGAAPISATDVMGCSANVAQQVHLFREPPRTRWMFLAATADTGNVARWMATARSVSTEAVGLRWSPQSA
jgi:hypothetical protein